MTLQDHLHLRVVVAVGLAIGALAIAEAWSVPAVVTAIRCTASVKGTVTGHAPRGRDSDWLIVTFSVNGQDYRVRDTVANSVNAPVIGDRIDVEYNPDHPNEAALHRIQDLILAGLAQLLATLLAFAAIAFCIRRHRAELRALAPARALT